MRTIKIFDSTLRDGEQAPGFSMTSKEKLKMALQLEKLGCDYIEAGFPASSPSDFESCKVIAESLTKSSVVALARLNENDILRAYEAIQNSNKPRLHVFIATSDIHMRDKLHMTKEQVLEAVRRFVALAKSKIDDVEFSAEDATRSDLDFLTEVYKAAVESGANVINIPDTVGYARGSEIVRIINHLRKIPELNYVPISCHCHNDLGLAVSNSLDAIVAGASQVECTVNGIGERAGNAALEEIVMNLRVRNEFYGADTNINSELLVPTGKLLSMITGVKVQPNKAITGANAFAHEAGIHQHGVMCNRLTYEIISPESVGVSESNIVLGKHSGRHAFAEKLQYMGYNIKEEDIDSLFKQFKKLADKKKTVTDNDIDALVKNAVLEVPQVYKIDTYVINSSNMLASTCSIRLLKDGVKTQEGYAMGSGPIEAAFNAINNALALDITLLEYKIEAVTGGIDAQGAVSVRISYNDNKYKGYGVDLNIFEASIKAYINAINNII